MPPLARNTKEHFITKPEDFLDKVVRLDPHKTRRMSGHMKLVKMLYDAKGKDTPIVAFVFGPLGRSEYDDGPGSHVQVPA